MSVRMVYGEVKEAKQRRPITTSLRMEKERVHPAGYPVAEQDEKLVDGLEFGMVLACELQSPYSLQIPVARVHHPRSLEC